MNDESPESWRARIDSALRDSSTFRKAIVLTETASTQDAARPESIGTVVAAMRQSRGRGRLGRAWADTGTEGVAVTFVAPDAAPERLVMASAVAAACAVEPSLGRETGIKWPNDIVVDGRKLAGILIERVDGRTLVGVGINVGQRAFPGDLAATATSVAILGGRANRLEILANLIREMDRALVADGDSLGRAYARRDVLVGTAVRVRTGGDGGEVTDGVVVRVDPHEGVVLRTARGERRLAAATTTVLAWEPRPREKLAQTQRGGLDSGRDSRR